MAKALITGGSGFIGSHLCEYLLDMGWDVTALDNFSTGRRRNLDSISSPCLEIVEHDITERFHCPGSLDYVLHLASPASPVDYFSLPIETLRVGSRGTENALELAKEKGARFLLASTSEVYGDPTVNPQSEEYRGNVNPVGVRSVYDEAKRYAEAVTMAYHRHRSLDTRIVRIFNTYGPRMRESDGRVVPNFICQGLRGEPITVYGDGSQTRSFCYVSDLVKGIYKVLVSDYVMPVNLGCPDEITIFDFARLVIGLTGGKSEIVLRDLPEDDPQVRCPDITVAQSRLGWRPEEDLEDGLMQTIMYFREDQDLW